MALPFFGIGMKTDLSSPAATAEFSKFAGILSAEYIMGNAGLDEALATASNVQMILPKWQKAKRN